MKRFMFSVLFIYLCILTGCATLRGDYNGPDKGMVIVTLTGSKEDHIAIYSLRLRKKDDSSRGVVMYIPHGIFGQTPCDFEKDTYHGFVKVLKLEPGEYEVFNVELVKAPNTVYTAKEEFSNPFIVKEGETIYIGEYCFGSIEGKSLLGFPLRKFYFTVSDQSGRDIPLAIRKEPTIREDKVKVQISKGERIVN
jgi:hypothetical protein